MVTNLLDRLGLERVDVVANDSGGAIASCCWRSIPDVWRRFS
jgi:pimeloyl-ACP methyl ester carboxylesterase